MSDAEISAVIGKLADYERDVLRTAAGDDRMTGWGGATTAAVEHLQGLGLLVQRNKMSGVQYEPTELGAKVATELARLQP